MVLALRSGSIVVSFRSVPPDLPGYLTMRKRRCAGRVRIMGASDIFRRRAPGCRRNHTLDVGRPPLDDHGLWPPPAHDHNDLLLEIVSYATARHPGDVRSGPRRVDGVAGPPAFEHLPEGASLC